MKESLELKNAKGYRSKYINALNEAVKQTRVVGGDVAPTETEGGTFLHIRGWAEQARFQLFAGVAPLNGSLFNVRAVSDGCFFVGGQFIKLKNAKNTHYAEGGLLPRGSGWYNDVAPSTWLSCSVVILAYDEAYYLAFRFDDTALWELIPGGTESIESEITILFTIGVWDNSNKKVIQYVNSDIYYGGSGGTASPTLEPWEVFSTIENGETRWWIANPEWNLNAPYVDYPEGATHPSPETAGKITDLFDTSIARMINGVWCWPLTIIPWDIAEGFTDVYAVLPPDGVPRPYLPLGWPMSCAVDIVENPVCIKIGTFTRDANNNITGWTQLRKGALDSKWSETEPYYIANDGVCGSVNRYTDGTTGLEEGTDMQKHSFWVLETSQKTRFLFRSEKLQIDPNYSQFPYPQYAIWYGNYIWRYNVHWSEQQKALLKDKTTTAMLNVETEILARVLDLPFVERVQVVYPETPLDQGSVDAVNGTVKMLAVENVELETTSIFKTEVVDTVYGETIEVSE